MSIGDIFDTAANIGTLGAYGLVKSGIGASNQPLNTADIEAARKNAAAQMAQLNAERSAVNPVAPTVTAPTIDQSLIAPDRARSQAALDLLQSRATGNTLSPAELAYQNAANETTAQQMGIAGAAAGTPGGIAARQEAADNIAKARNQAALGMAQVHAGETAQAAGQFAGATNQAQQTEQALALERARQALSAGTTSAELAQRSTEAANQYKLGLGSQALTANAQAGGAAQDIQAMREARRKSDLDRLTNLYTAGARTAGSIATGGSGGGA